MGTSMGTAIMTVTPTRMDISGPSVRPAAVLFAWFSPAFPTGGFAYSHGLETLAAEGRVAGEEGLRRWLGQVLVHGAGWSDAVLFAMAHRASLEPDDAGLRHAAALAAALAPSRERLAESMGQGSAFLAAVHEGWPDAEPVALGKHAPLPCAAGACCAGAGTPIREALEAYLTAFAASLIAAGIRLGLCGQTGGVRILAALGPVIGDLALRGADADEDDLGGCALACDAASMRHQSLNGRLFLS